MKKNKLFAAIAAGVISMSFLLCSCSDNAKVSEPADSTLSDTGDRTAGTESSVAPTDDQSDKDVYTSEYSTATVTIPPLAHTHDLTYVGEVPATDTTEGVKEHWHCDGCDKNFADENGKTEMTDTKLTTPVISHTHNLAHVPEVPATDTTEGIKEHWHCDGCDKNFADENGKTEMTETNLTLPVIGPTHDLTHVPEAPAANTANAEQSDTSDSVKPDVPKDIPKDHGEMRGLTAKELIAEMKTGWNLGNSLDAIGPDETAWGNPVTTKEMIDAVSAQGFDILRVPVTWGQHMGTGTDYTVDPKFMARVVEVVDYGINNGMYVILDTHHEPDSWLRPQSGNMEKIEPKFADLWRQISERFADYGDHLIFEGINEARIKGSPNEWTGGTEDERECVNRLNKIFVDTVRATGGKNSKRLLLVSTYAHAVTNSAFKGFVAEYDQYTGVSVHAYTPYSFTYHSGESYETFKWDGREKNSIAGVFKLIDKQLISKGIPVIITEYGAVRKQLEDGTYNTEDVIAWLSDYLGAAKELGIPCVWWDNNFYNSGNELFGIFDRGSCKWSAKEIADAIVDLYK